MTEQLSSLSTRNRAKRDCVFHSCEYIVSTCSVLAVSEKNKGEKMRYLDENYMSPLALPVLVAVQTV